MRSALAVLLALTCAGSSPSSSPRDRETAQPRDRDYDIRIVHGDVIDGTGKPRFRADVGIRGDAIAAIGDLSNATSTITIDATNQVVTPGFIDLLGHSEASVLLDPQLEGKIRQGVTTEVTGEGHSPGPINDAMAAEINRTRLPGYPDATWRSLDDFMRVIEKHGSAINFAFYVGAANPREIVLGTADRAPTAAELAKMESLVDESMRAGAVGMSTALIYPPGRFAATEELIALGKVVSKYHGSYWTHLRNEADRILPALDEAFRIGREAKLPVNIFHLKTGGKMRGHMSEVIAKIEAARASGLDVASQIYPYTATSTDLTSIVSAWALDGGYLAFVARLKDPAMRTRIANEMRTGSYISQGGNGILVRGIQSSDSAIKAFERKRLDDIAKSMNTDPAEAALRIFERSNSSPIAIFFGLSEDDLKLAMKQPWVAVGSDSSAVVGPMRQFGAHPRAYGTFPRILGHYVRDEHLFPLEEAVRKMTSLAASRAKFADRGTLRIGMRADVVVFNPATIRDVSIYEDPHHFSEGISNVIVNGVPVLQDGKMTGRLGGRVLRRP
ncbi:MAG: N-acyl-D-amino-acid deacylase [Thermoanaerobaculia bacterium]|nr:N-acyl-D-amino-acid deacylase [Thermoanaerobaculia bacterium]